MCFSNMSAKSASHGRASFAGTSTAVVRSRRPASSFCESNLFDVAGVYYVSKIN
jgi:hypothetical protein